MRHTITLIFLIEKRNIQIVFRIMNKQKKVRENEDTNTFGG
jgi:hypothetical protein